MEIAFFTRLKLSDWYDPTLLNLTGNIYSQNANYVISSHLILRFQKFFPSYIKIHLSYSTLKFKSFSQLFSLYILD